MEKIRVGKRQTANRVKWVRALLSGDYEQGSFKLKRNDNVDRTFEYCCLGVACETVSPKAGELILNMDGTSPPFMNRISAQKLLGINWDDQKVAGVWNDRNHYTFERIADLVAYATEDAIRFDDVIFNNVEEGYATTWLRQFD